MTELIQFQTWKWVSGLMEEEDSLPAARTKYKTHGPVPEHVVTKISQRELQWAFLCFSHVAQTTPYGERPKKRSAPLLGLMWMGTLGQFQKGNKWLYHGLPYYHITLFYFLARKQTRLWETILKWQFRAANILELSSFLREDYWKRKKKTTF